MLLRIIDSIRGESLKRQWIIFDGDVDPEWVENLNSVLDDNKLLTLPNGERLAIPPNVRIMFEVQDLKYATLATVSRCGMMTIDEAEEDISFTYAPLTTASSQNDLQPQTPSPSEPVETLHQQRQSFSPSLQVQRDIAGILAPYFTDNGLISRCLEYARSLDHVMDFTRLRALTSLFALLKQGVRNVLAYNLSHLDFPLTPDQLEAYISRYLISSTVWALAGDGRLRIREQLSDFIRSITTLPLPPPGSPIIDYEVSLTGDWIPWIQKVPAIEVETHKITLMDAVVPTLDTVRHESLLYTWLAEHRPMLIYIS
ncbi:unnamed protein product [Protopolystoma xenopodis]|uniref:Dynein heavy chain AAA 5 extension domain-containing protein n=1 Tax=Protopolystoma xenopodis TaxID=117903 RepID=A0A448WDN1_9PLAT|nr:unnamed protein product [Protopolystoma xenopodis]